MTFRVYFFAEQAFLSQVKTTLATKPVDVDQEIESGAICSIACAAAIEAIANGLLSSCIDAENFDDLRIASKFERIAKSNGSVIRWGEAPWQSIGEIIRVRNWLTHFKSSNIGLVNSEGEWLKDDCNKIPKFDPDIHLRRERIGKYYTSVLEASKFLVLCCKGELGEYAFLETQEYQSILVG